MYCPICGHRLSSGAATCPMCRTRIAPPPPTPRGLPFWLSWRWTVRHLLVGLLLLLLPAVPHVIHYLNLRLPLRTSTLVREAVARASHDPPIADGPGKPLRAHMK